METGDQSSPSPLMPVALSLPILTAVFGGVVTILFLADYFRRKRREVTTLTQTQTQTLQPPAPASAVVKKPQPRVHPHRAADKEAARKHHPLDINTLKGHTDGVTALCFSDDGHNLATVCADGVIRVFRIDDASSKSFKQLRINLPAGAHPTGVAFSEGASSVVVTAQVLLGSSLYIYGNVDAKPAGVNKQGKVPLPEIICEHSNIHGKESVLNLTAARATYGTGDGSTIIASCSEETSIKVWHGKSGKELGKIDTNQLRNNMVDISPNGRHLAAAAFTADVKVWEIVYSKDGSVKEVVKVMQLKGHKSAVTSLCFTPNSEQIITASKDGTIRRWNINVRYHLDEDPKTLSIFAVPLRDSEGAACHYDHMRISPDGKILAVTSRSTLQWVSVESGEVLDSAEKAHEGNITGIVWAPQLISNGGAPSFVLATAGEDKKVKLWTAPGARSS